jgi:hypothetical protein
MAGAFVLGLVALTSVVAGLIEARRQPRPAAALRAAIGKALEAVGLTLAFFLANVAIGAAVTLAVRVLSLLQALVFQRWREARAGSAPVDIGQPPAR